MATKTPSSHRAYAPVLGDALFLLGYACAYLAVMALLRAVLLYTNSSLAAQIPLTDLLNAFGVGLRFDLIVTCIIMSPLVLAMLFPNGLGSRRLAIFWLGIVGSLTIFAGVAEIEFYREFHMRLNSIAFHYLQEDTATVTSMIWNGFPVVQYLLLWSLLSALFVGALVWVNRSTKTTVVSGYQLFVRMPVFLLIFFLVAWGGRGTLRSGPPLRWGDAFHSQHLFANHLALNGAYTLAKAATAKSDGSAQKNWMDSMPGDQALSVLRKTILTPNDKLLAAETFPILRRHTPVVRLPAPPKNIVFIMMESFSGAYTGALSGVEGITPEFDKLARTGLLFDRFFSNGTHTHQGMFASLACFPNLPGHEYLMQQPEGQHQFSGLPALLAPLGFNDAYVYNGHFAWDNQKGFFRNQGMTNFIGRDEYVDPVYMDPTWGVSDEDMFNRAIQEIGQLDSVQPFYAFLQTLSNHVPYALPDNLSFEPITGYGRLDAHLTAQRYSDWALGQFFAKARQEPWYEDTLFLIAGDHGFGLDRQLTDIDLLRFHVPLLILGKDIQATYGQRNDTVATQVDIVPTIVGLLGKPFTHQCWGRNLLALPEGDRGIGVIKPSGSDQTVALISGNEILVKPPGSEFRTGTYSLYPEMSYTPINNSSAELELKLKAFIQVALKALKENRTGLKDDSSSP